MSHTFLLEIGVEEMPAHVVTPSIKQLATRVSSYLEEARIDFDDIKEFATPRRMALLISGLADKQPDIDEEVKGPAKKIAQDDEGNWSKAAIGFTRGQGVTVDDITFKELKGVEYVYVEKHVAGQSVNDILTGLDKVIMAMNFPTMMKWSTHKFEFVRPIKWLVALLDDQVIPFSILDITTGNQSMGHRFLGKSLELKTATDYEAALEAEFVIADQAKRKALIREQIAQIAKQHDWLVDVDEALLEEVNNLVEWPTAFNGAFDEQYLVLPDEVLITSMKEHQRFFFVRSHDGKLLPNFISVRNGNAAHLDNVARGNERVLTARLEDAKFFYEEDQQVTISEYVERLKNVTFHDKIGSMYEKMQRVTVLAAILGDKLSFTDAEQTDLKRASQIYKFDLTTGMVGEFAELQGVMGEKYALLQGETADVAKAVREHYLPISAEGSLPESKIGSVLAIADKFESMLSFFSVGMIPSGSNDPYALRRQAFGIVRIIEEKQWHLELLDIETELVKSMTEAGVNPNFDMTKVTADVNSFISDRIRLTLENKKYRYDIIEAAVTGKQNDIAKVIETATVLDAHKDDANFKDSIEALTRVLRIAQKNEINPDHLAVDAKLFQAASEQQLLDQVTVIENAAVNTIEQVYQQLASLQPTIEAYFDDNMIMDKDEQVKNNRLNQLARVAKLTEQLGNLNELIVK
ncbi:glycyl-tRNA synthetase subunit beta [Paucilactobacillus oligofermentans DSM 15707 = LMG 22743]|uniref:Glycine--tRNA ligase beta subunit n=1 Tax=Paucilactobacillus oligofermentans DSM 15707 = LMG 22743 TaxID=1423778 RepID=A0A0R1RCH4_9LACO|nr:glycine--tRNA ligase subunit beta [Paucilactobacillus oligofermentans]KRL54800.1 glycyl-tRNA synthetase subunit beta [Paucilactobacillus oligofermentans DSM 15707 = LMG 22743]CUS26285.1 Glycyl-tRNA synthetase beta subunit [Paucilactobacillus oligofermentans DSM 15707 = LMG 22743]